MENMVEKIMKELETRMNASENKCIFVTLKSNGREVQISEETNMWTGQIFYDVNYVTRNDAEYVIEAIHVGTGDTLTQVAEWLSIR